MPNINSYKLKAGGYLKIANQLGFNPTKTKFTIKLKHAEVLNRKTTDNKKLKEAGYCFNKYNTQLKNYKYFRNINGYPCRGQRTHTNAKTKKKNKFKNIL